MLPVNAEDEGPELVLVLKEWFPLPNGSYHLRAVFNIKNYIHRITLPQAYSVGSNNADIAVSLFLVQVPLVTVARWLLCSLGGRV